MNGLLVTFEDELVLVEEGYLLHPNRERRLFPRDAVEVIDWEGVDIRHESAGSGARPRLDSVPRNCSAHGEADWEIVIDDDGTGDWLTSSSCAASMRTWRSFSCTASTRRSPYLGRASKISTMSAAKP